MIPKVCGRFTLAAASLVAAFVLVWFGKDVMGFTAALTAILGFYSGSATLQSYFDSKFNSPRGKPPVPPKGKG